MQIFCDISSEALQKRAKHLEGPVILSYKTRYSEVKAGSFILGRQIAVCDTLEYGNQCATCVTIPTYGYHHTSDNMQSEMLLQAVNSFR